MPRHRSSSIMQRVASCRRAPRKPTPTGDASWNGKPRLPAIFVSALKSRCTSPTA